MTSRRNRYDVIIIGAGPAGIFTALELIKKNNLKVLMIEKGKDIEERRCPAREKHINCTHCSPCSILCGWGGAGAFSDGKLTLSSEVGGFLDKFIPPQALNDLIHYCDEIYLSFGAPHTVYGASQDKVKEIQRNAAKASLQLLPANIRHLGTERAVQILSQMKKTFEGRVDLKIETSVEEIIVEEGKAKGVRTSEGEEFYGEYIVAAPGREGAEWLSGEAKRLGLTTLNNPVDVGVRVELPAAVIEDLTEVLYEVKLVYYSRSFDDKVRTFCMCPYGEVVTECFNGVITVNGHSYIDKRTNNTNFALLISTNFTEPFNEPVAYGKYLARLANILGGGVIVQRLGDLQAGRRSTKERISRGLVEPTLKDSTPGDLSFVLPYRYLADIMEMLRALDELAPGINSPHTLLYGVEVKFYSMRLKSNEALETEIKNLFAIGDGAGVSRGLIQASCSGVIAAREILRRLGG